MKPARSLLLACLCGLGALAPVQAADASFDRVVRALSQHYHAKPLAGLSLATFFMRPFTPSGVHGLSLAVFDKVQEPVGSSAGLEQDLQAALDPSYAPFVRLASVPRQELTRIYLREDGGRFHLLLVNTEAKEAVVIGMRLDPEALKQWLDDPEGMSRSTTSHGPMK